jgi:hypothetical protein
MRRWVEIERDGRTIGTFVDDGPPVARSALPLPYVISDTMEPTEQVDGRFYTSKSQFRAVGKALGLIEVGNEKPKPKTRSSADPAVRRARQAQIKTAIEKVRAGHYERYFFPDGTSRRRRATAAADRGDDT